ncbi:MAG: hypothetical protein IPO92_04340 [Saprospiraceae bacterium]|nr:hypothetical protein [Saprospiraceae bacterium]
MSTNFPRFVLLLSVVCFSSTQILCQSSKEAVILYDSRPVLAEIRDGGIIDRIIKDEPDYLEGYTLKIQDYGQFLTQKKLTEVSEVKSSGGYAVVSKDEIIVPFDTGYATLSDKAIKVLDNVISRLRTKSESKVVLRTLNTFDESLLSKNRVNSIRTYFKIRE